MMDFFLKTIHFIKYFKVHLRIKNRDFYPLDFDTGKKIEDVQTLGLQSPALYTGTGPSQGLKIRGDS